mgnify:CR=1 FL=1
MENVKSMNNTTKESTSSYSPNILESLLNLNYNPMAKSEENNIEELIQSKFYSSKKFAEEIESIVHENKEMKYLDAIIVFCEKNNLDVDSIPKLVSKPLKEKLKAEAIDLNLLKRTSHAKLPLWYPKCSPLMSTNVILD